MMTYLPGGETKRIMKSFFCCARGCVWAIARWLGLLPTYICSPADNNPRTGGPQQLWGRVVGASRVVALPICRDPVVE
jgi:hypothetical protein